MENFAVNNLNAILKLDEKIYDRLYELGGGNVNALESQRVIDKLRAERFLDKPPGNIKLSNSGIQSGCQELFRRALQSLPSESESTEGVIDFVGNIMTADIYVIKAMKALYIVGTSFNSDLSSACKNIIKKLIQIHSAAVVKATKEYINERLVADGYYEQKLIEVFFEEFPER